MFRNLRIAPAMSVIFALSIPLAAVVPLTAAAEESVPSNEPGAKEKAKLLHEPLSVYEIKPARDWTLLGVGTALAVFPALNGYNFIHIQTNPNPENLTPWDQKYIYYRNVFLDNVSDATVVLSVAAPVFLDYFDVGWNRALYEDLMVYAQAMIDNSVLSAFFKYTTQRPIPRVYAGDESVRNSHRGYEGFYSGHVSTTMCALSAAALTLDLRHDAGVWPWAVVAVVGASVAVERVQAGEHFPTQVLAGAVMGPIIGTFIPWLHKRHPIDPNAEIGVSPVESGAELTWTRHF